MVAHCGILEAAESDAAAKRAAELAAEFGSPIGGRLECQHGFSPAWACPNPAHMDLSRDGLEQLRQVVKAEPERTEDLRKRVADLRDELEREKLKAEARALESKIKQLRGGLWL